MPIPVIYIAGPYRAATRAAVELNIQVARKLGALACLKGWMPIIPHANTAHLDEIAALPDEFWLDGTLELMRRADAVLLCPGWERSTGTLAEMSAARLQGLPMFLSENELPLAHEFNAQRLQARSNKAAERSTHGQA